MAEKISMTREEYNETFGANLTEEEYRKIMATTILNLDTSVRVIVVEKETGKRHLFTRVNTLLLNIDGKDRIHVEVKRGITIDGIVTTAQKFGNRFRIDGYLTEGES